MATATKNLEDDHVHILRLTDVIEHITRIDQPDINHLKNIIAIIKNFADGIHHAKEENIFFPFLTKKGFSPERGPVAVMLNEHVEGRRYVRGMEENLAFYMAGNKPSLQEVYLNMRSYAGLLRNHIAKENNVLFRMADNVISENENSELLEKFSSAQEEHNSSLKASDYVNMIDEMTSAYGI